MSSYRVHELHAETGLRITLPAALATNFIANSFYTLFPMKRSLRRGERTSVRPPSWTENPPPPLSYYLFLGNLNYNKERRFDGIFAQKRCSRSKDVRPASVLRFLSTCVEPIAPWKRTCAPGFPEKEEEVGERRGYRVGRQWRRGSVDSEAVASSEWRTTRRCPPNVTNDLAGPVEYIWSGQSELKSLRL